MKHIEINIGKACNNKCRFCMSSKSELWDIKFVSFDILKEKIKSYAKKGYDSIGFLGGDVSIHPNLLEIVAFCKKSGFKNINIISNAMVFDDYELAKKLVYNGLTRLNISIHSHKSKIEDYLIQVKGGLERKLKAIDNFKDLYNKGLLRDDLSINIVLNKKNYTTVVESCLYFFLKKKIKDIRINFIWLNKDVKENWDDLKVSYSEFLPYLKQLIYISIKYNIRITFDTIPACIFYKINSKNYKKLIKKFLGEDFDHITEIDHINNSDNFDWKQRKKDILKTQFKNCEICEYKNICEGVWKEYGEIYGGKEFYPIYNEDNIGDILEKIHKGNIEKYKEIFDIILNNVDIWLINKYFGEINKILSLFGLDEQLKYNTILYKRGIDKFEVLFKIFVISEQLQKISTTNKFVKIIEKKYPNNKEFSNYITHSGYLLSTESLNFNDYLYNYLQKKLGKSNIKGKKLLLVLESTSFFWIDFITKIVFLFSQYLQVDITIASIEKRGLYVIDSGTINGYLKNKYGLSYKYKIIKFSEINLTKTYDFFIFNGTLCNEELNKKIICDKKLFFLSDFYIKPKHILVGKEQNKDYFYRLNKDYLLFSRILSYINFKYIDFGKRKYDLMVAGSKKGRDYDLLLYLLEKLPNIKVVIVISYKVDLVFLKEKFKNYLNRIDIYINNNSYFDFYKILSNSKIFLNSSKGEITYGSTGLLLPMSVKCIILSRTNDITKRYIKDGFNGFLYENKINALEKIKLILENNKYHLNEIEKNREKYFLKNEQIEDVLIKFLLNS